MQFLDHSNRRSVVLKGMGGLSTVACEKDVLVPDGKLKESSLFGFHGRLLSPFQESSHQED